MESSLPLDDAWVRFLSLFLSLVLSALQLVARFSLSVPDQVEVVSLRCGWWTPIHNLVIGRSAIDCDIAARPPGYIIRDFKLTYSPTVNSLSNHPGCEHCVNDPLRIPRPTPTRKASALPFHYVSDPFEHFLTKGTWLSIQFPRLRLQMLLALECLSARNPEDLPDGWVWAISKLLHNAVVKVRLKNLERVL